MNVYWEKGRAQEYELTKQKKSQTNSYNYTVVNPRLECVNSFKDGVIRYFVCFFFPGYIFIQA